MKFTAICMLGASVSAINIRYDESEGPTKADNGEVEETVVYREADIGNGVKASGWTNPLGWSDTGEDDDSVLVQINRTKGDAYDGDQDTVSPYDDMEQHKKFDWGVEGLKSAYGLQQRSDAYDGDHDTVSPYDDMEQHKKFDWGVEGLKSAYGLAQPKVNTDEFIQEQAEVNFLLSQHRNKKDAYDGDHDTVSPYDDMEQHKKFDWGVEGLKSAYGL